MEIHETEDILDRLVAIYQPREAPNTKAIEVWHDALRGTSYPDAREAVARYVRANEAWPLPSQLMGYIRHVSTLRAHDEAAQRAKSTRPTAQEPVGPFGPSPSARAKIRAAFGSK